MKKVKINNKREKKEKELKTFLGKFVLHMETYQETHHISTSEDF